MAGYGLRGSGSHQTRNKKRRTDRRTAQYRANERAIRREKSANDLETRPFICWDGEGYDDEYGDHKYMLFGCSRGDYVTGADLSTEECLDLLLDVETEAPNSYHVGFAFDYDVNMMLKDLEWRYLNKLTRTGQVVWRKYKIEHIPHKMFRVMKDGSSVTLYDVFGFFHSSYVKALRTYGVGTEQDIVEIEKGKARRGTFDLAQMPFVIEYWRKELELMVPLMEKIREAAYAGGYFIKEWHGPGALASFALRYHKASEWHMGKVRPEIQEAVTSAYAGGRFQAFLCGQYKGKVYTADINSAYIYACSLLPRLDNGKWFRQKPSQIRGPKDLARFGLYYIHFNDGSDTLKQATKHAVPMPPYPLFHRDEKGILTWPYATEGWYWNPEVQVAMEQYPDAVTIKEAWIYSDDGTYPFAWVHDAFNRRLKLQREGNPAEKAYKWALASMYGAFARRVGWDRKRKTAPPSHELAWAGFITSYCRAMVQRVAMAAYIRDGISLVSIDTDGITSLAPFDPETLGSPVGSSLGEWKLEEHDELLYWQNGIYWYRDGDKWSESKTRGIPKGQMSVELALEAMSQDKEIEVSRTRFIGYRQALRGQFKRWRRWETKPMKIKMGGRGKGFHEPRMCRYCLSKGKWKMHTVVALQPMNMRSVKRELPWMVKDDIQTGNVVWEQTWEDESI